ncbi:DUF4838 domain-containing protein [Microbacterium sp. NPDC089318]
MQLGAVIGVAAAFESLQPRAAFAAGPDISIAKDGKSAYSVFVGSGESPMTRQAATEFAEYAHRVTGAPFDVVSESSIGSKRPRLIIFGDDNRLARRFGHIDRSRLGDDGFALRTRGHDILVIGPGELGTLHGAYWLLETLFGVRWFSESYEWVPSTPTINASVSLLSQDYVPRYRFRQLHYGDAFSGEHRHHLALNGRRDIYDVEMPPALNTWSGYWPEDRPTFFRDLVTDPDLLQDENVRFMSEEARSQATESVIRIIRERIGRGEDASLGIIQWDRNPWTPDEDSQTFIDAHGGAGGAAMFDFVNDVATRVATVIPGARLETEAYQWSIQPPSGMSIKDNVVITVCPIFANRGKSLMDEANKEQWDYITGWSKICKNIVVWDYQTMFSSYLMPFPQWYDGFESIRQLAAIPEIQGLFIQGVWNTKGGEMSALRTWVLSRLAWDPTRKTDELVQEFLAGYYGAAAPHIDAYMRTLWTAKEAQGGLTEATHYMAPLYALNTVREADDHLARAEAAVLSDPDRLEHVQVARFNLDYVIFLRAPYYLEDLATNGQSWDMGLVARKERALRAIALSGIDKISEGGGDVERTVKEFDANPVAPGDVPAPAAVAGLPTDSWIDFQEGAMRIAATWMTSLAFDEKASNHRALRMDPNDSAWGVQFWLDALPEEGEWRLFVSLRADVGSLASSAPVVDTGVYPPWNVNVIKTAADLADGRYQEIELPGTFTRDPERLVYVQNLSKVPALWIDRVFAIRA